MSDWNAERYLKFKKQRTQPAIDLANRVKEFAPKRVVDLGCGPGNSTAVLKEILPNAQITGIDSSPDMIQKARQNHPDMRFELCTADELEAGWDMIFSNACLQWIPEHEVLIPELIEKLNDGGVLAVQVPNNQEEKIFKYIKEVAAEPEWGLQHVYFEKNDILKPEEYFKILSECSSDFEMWETTYYHRMPSHNALLEWVKSTRLRPYLDALGEEKGTEFEKAILDRCIEGYPVQSNGEIIFRFRRLFFYVMK